MMETVSFVAMLEPPAMTSLSALSSTDPLAALLQTQSTSDPSTAVPSSTLASSLAPAATASISGAGQLFSLLQQLQQTNPTQFKQVTGQIASQLSAAAQQQSGGASTVLSQLANKFQQASQSGSLGSFTGPQGAHHGHHHHGTYNRSGQAVTSSSDTTSQSSLNQLFSSIADNLNSTLGASAGGTKAA
jgi:hypothetical protein